MSEPVVVLPVPGNGILYHLRLRDMVVLGDDALGSLDDPRQDRATGLVVQVVGVVLDVRVALDLCVEGDDDQPTPCPGVNGTNLGQMVGIEHEGVAGHIGKRVLVLFLGVDLVGGAELLHVGGVQPHAFLQLGGDDETFALGLSQLRLDIPLAADRQGIGGHVAAVGTQHTGDGIPEGRLAVAAFTIGDDQRFDIDLADGGEAHDLLHIAHELDVTEEEGIQRGIPDILAGIGRVHGGHLRNEVSGTVFVCVGDAHAQVIGPGRRVQQELIRVQLLLVDLQLGTGFLQCGGDILRVPALDGIVPVGGCDLVFLEGPRLLGVEGGGSTLGSHRGQKLPCSVGDHLIGGLLDLGLGLLKLPVREFLCNGL